jgi:hypothetical protein
MRWLGYNTNGFWRRIGALNVQDLDQRLRGLDEQSHFFSKPAETDIKRPARCEQQKQSLGVVRVAFQKRWPARVALSRLNWREKGKSSKKKIWHLDMSRVEGKEKERVVDGERLLEMVYCNIPRSAFLFFYSSQMPSVPKGDFGGKMVTELDPRLLRSGLHVPGR